MDLINNMEDIFIRNIIESLSVGIVVINNGGEIFYANDFALTTLGYVKEKFLARGWGEIFSFDVGENAEFNQIIIDVIMGEKLNMHREVDYLKPDGKKLRLSVATSLLKDKGDVAGIVVLIDDITEVYELRRLEICMLEEQQRLQQDLFEGVNKLAMSVAHVIRNPIASIGGFARLILKKAPVDWPYRGYLSSIDEGIQRLEKIVSSVKDYTDINKATIRRTSLSGLIATAIRNVEVITKKLGFSATWDVSLQCGDDVDVDPVLLLGAVEEILYNSVESFVSSAGKMRIKAHVGNDSQNPCEELYLEIEDNGSGISEKEMPFIFDPFFTTKTSNVGVGLLKVKKIVAAHGGSIYVDSKKGTGTKVTIRLPILPKT
ncbi:MAG: PAS domain S-box protein [Nitrospirae bacterium]|nr:PAS domain S-box protein [Nitrospirota bacterium]